MIFRFVKRFIAAFAFMEENVNKIVGETLDRRVCFQYFYFLIWFTFSSAQTKYF